MNPLLFTLLLVIIVAVWLGLVYAFVHGAADEYERWTEQPGKREHLERAIRMYARRGK